MQPAARNPAILLVEDDPGVLALLAGFVTAFGFSSQCVSNGQEAIDLLAQREFDIVVTDVLMPLVSGIELLAHIQEHYPNIDVVMITGYAGTISSTDLVRSGASDFIAKPFARDEFQAKLNRIVRERKVVSELGRHSICDSLTGLYNRRHFDVRLWEEAQRSDRQRYLLYLAVLDIDHFKLYNDAFGHQAGDRLLRDLGKVLVSCTRENVDSCYRWGGDEFTLIIPQANREQVVQIAERIVTTYGELDCGMTELSIGLARFQRRQDEPWAADITEVLTSADQAMYAAKVDPSRQIAWSAE